MLKGLFSRGGAGEAAQASQIKHWARGILGEEAEFMVSEIDCGDPACPGLETVLLVLRAGQKTRAAKIGKPMAEVTEQDLRDGLDGLNGDPPR